jgi:hypothetical protein
MLLKCDIVDPWYYDQINYHFHIIYRLKGSIMLSYIVGALYILNLYKASSWFAKLNGQILCYYIKVRLGYILIKSRFMVYTKLKAIIVMYGEHIWT